MTLAQRHLPRLRPKRCIKVQSQSKSLVEAFERERDRMSADLEELRSQVKGLQEAFVCLKNEHTDLRGELRSSGATCSLPVDPFHAGSAKSGGPAALNNLTTSPQGYSTLSTDDALGPDAISELAPRKSIAGEDFGLLGSLFGTCGFDSGSQAVPRSNVTAKAILAEHSNPQSSTSDQTRNREFRCLTSSNLPPPPAAPLSNFSGSARSSPRVEPHPNVAAARTNAGGDSQGSVRSNQTGLDCMLSPHDRELPMDGRMASAGATRRESVVARALTSEQTASKLGTLALNGASSGLSSPSEASPRLASSTDQDCLEACESPRFGPRAASSVFDRSAARSSHGGDNSRTGKLPAWRSPRTGEPLVLPFPEAADEDEGLSKSTEASGDSLSLPAAAPPTIEIPRQRPPPVPPFSVPLADLAASSS